MQTCNTSAVPTTSTIAKSEKVKCQLCVDYLLTRNRDCVRKIIINNYSLYYYNNIPFMMTMYTSTLRVTIDSSNHGNAIIGTTHTGVLVVFTEFTVIVSFVMFGKSADAF